MNENTALLTEYLNEIDQLYRSGYATEHSYRPALKNLIEAATGLVTTNEPKRTRCGAPDYVVTRNNRPVGYVEAKDIGGDLSEIGYKP
ncbi:hypothetical protein FACS1894172_07620 [Spirochaetia bacterium]|nr:hypothetical protein FACS1894172_07620 [Spirochaetia bacterium]